MSSLLNNNASLSGSSKKRKLAPTVVMSAMKPINPDLAIVNININSTNIKQKTNDNMINYNIKNLLSEEGNLVLDYTQLLSSEHQQRHLLQELQELQDEDDDIEEESEAEEDGNDDESEDDSSENEEKTSEVLPKKRVSKYKGKAMVGKYDLEDPFIDDSEHQLEDSRRNTGQGVGFFVFFGEFESKDIQK